MMPAPTSPSDTTILLGCALIFLAFSITNAYAVLSPRCNCRFFELQLREKETVNTTKACAMGALVLAFTLEKEEWQKRALALEKSNEELVLLVARRDAEHLNKISDVDRRWSKALADIQTKNELETQSFKVNLRAMKATCTSRGYQIQDLTQDKEELQAARVQQEQKILELADNLRVSECARHRESVSQTNMLSLIKTGIQLEATRKQQEHKILELTDKLSEYHRRLSTGGPLDPLYNLSPSPPDSAWFQCECWVKRDERKTKSAFNRPTPGMEWRG